MTGAEFLRRVRRLGRKRGVPVRFVAHRGKGSHGTLYYGDQLTVVKDRRKEMSKPLLRTICKQLGLKPQDLEQGRRPG